MIDDLIESYHRLAEDAEGLSFASPVEAVYNPLRYAWQPFEIYLRRFGKAPKPVLFLGMNPGPWGMAQTGVPFGEVTLVADWLGIDAPVGKPPTELPSRPVDGFACKRSEVSGRRLWGLFRGRFGGPALFFETNFVVNYCPLLFLADGGRNITPDRLAAADRTPLTKVCDRALARVVEIMKPAWLVGVGRYAESKAATVVGSSANNHGCRTAGIPHPSPASPLANKGWEGIVTRELEDLGIWTRETVQPPFAEGPSRAVESIVRRESSERK